MLAGGVMGVTSLDNLTLYFAKKKTSGSKSIDVWGLSSPLPN